MIDSNLGIGPMSTEVIEAVFRYSHFHRKQIMLIASKNQIDHSGVYVNAWTTKDYSDALNELKKKYNFNEVVNCRDHCGPGFNGNYDLDDTYDTIKADVNNNFDLIHIDFCHYKGSNAERLMESKKAIEFCISLNENILIEIGTDENMGDKFSLNSLEDVEKEIEYFLDISKPEFFVVQTGSLVMEINQVGSFNSEFCKEIASIIRKKGLKFSKPGCTTKKTPSIPKIRDRKINIFIFSLR